MHKPGDRYIPLLHETGCDHRVIAHCIAVRDYAIEIADRMLLKQSATPDRDLIGDGAILHDIGRSVTHGMDHADQGVLICQEYKLDNRICQIVGRHIGAGLSSEDRVSFGLEALDTIPQTLEEKIVAHADNMIKGDRLLTREEFLHSLSKYTPVVQNRFRTLANEIEELIA